MWSGAQAWAAMHVQPPLQEQTGDMARRCGMTLSRCAAVCRAPMCACQLLLGWLWHVHCGHVLLPPPWWPWHI